MSSTDKGKLDGATPNQAPDSIVWRNSDGFFAVPAPTSGVHPANRSFVENLFSQGLIHRGDAPTHLNNAQQLGVYNVQPSTSTGGNPASQFATLLVLQTSQSSNFSWQILLQHSNGVMWIRSRHTTLGWMSWNRMMSESDVESAIDSRWLVQGGAGTRNLNTVTQVGTHAFGVNSTNTPETGAGGVVEVLPLSTTRIMQRLTYPTRDYRQYCRQQNESGSFTPWVRTV